MEGGAAEERGLGGLWVRFALLAIGHHRADRPHRRGGRRVPDRSGDLVAGARNLRGRREARRAHPISERQVFLISLTILLLLGLLRREKHGVTNIGFEGFLILVLYFGSFAFLLIAG